jgi:signal transduction histidine kinase
MDGQANAPALDPRAERRLSLGTQPATAGERRLALAVIAVSAAVFLLLVPFAKQPLGQVWAFIPMYQSALMISDLVTAWLLFAQFWSLRSRALLALASAYVFSALITAMHTMSFPGLFAERGLLGSGPQTTAWLYMFWHLGFPLLVIAYALLKERRSDVRMPAPAAVALAVCGVAAAVGGFMLLATAGKDLLPPIMAGNRYTPLMIGVVSSVWAASLVALAILWVRRPHTVLDLWLMVVLCAWLFDIGLAAVFNAGRFDLGFYAGRVYGLLAASFVLFVLLAESARLYARLAASFRTEARERRRVEQAVVRHEERLRILHEIDRGMAASESAEQIAAAVIQPLRELLGVPRAIVNRFDLERGEVEWVAAAGRKQVRLGPGVRYGLAMMGDVEALRRGEVQRVDTRALPPGPDVEALLASGVDIYMVVPMIAGGELLGAISFGGESGEFPPEQLAIAREVAAQLAIATVQTRLIASVRQHAAELEKRVAERTASLEATNKELESFSYSVSHDLRAPLRAIDGYARMLEEETGARLGDEGRRLLGVVRASAHRMGRLIDDLLEFSRLGQLEPARTRLDMAGLARDVAAELAREFPKAAVAVGELPAALADRALLKQVWLNLIGNALKYSAQREAPRVEIAGRVEDGMAVYSVRDNGVGFDMRYAGKLFAVFQRLHRQDEFPGTGVGLAIVQRVVVRHGGRVWAEATLHEGACFSFSVPSA